MEKQIFVTKRNGEKDQFSPEKINKLAEWSCNGLNANTSDVVMNTNIKVFDGIKTSKIHELLIQSAVDLIDIKNTDYQYVAGKLLALHTRKQIFGVTNSSEMPTIKDVIDWNIALGFYDPTLSQKFSSGDMAKLENTINHDNDFKFTYAQLRKLNDSYAVRNRVKGHIYETPQYIFMVVSMYLYDTVDAVIDHYNELVNETISYPTPIWAGLRTQSKQFASCTLIEIDDDLDSIGSSNHAGIRFISRKAGIGFSISRWRAEGSGIRNGEVKHTGIIPFLKQLQATTKSCSQGAVRDGSATVSYAVWNPEIFDLLVLKNNKGTDDNRVKNLDYCVQITGYFLKKMIKNEKIALFSTSDVPNLIDLWGLPEFDAEYEKYCADDSVKKTWVDGLDILVSIVTERLNTGRIYISFIDNINKKNSFLEPIRMTNLCVEIVQPTKPFYDINSGDGEISLCNLGGINLGVIKGSDTFHLLEKPIEMLVRSLNKVISIQDYPVIHAKHQLKRRNIGIGVTNFAYWMAKNGLSYLDDSSLVMIDELFEHIQFYLIKASNKIAKESGACEWFDKTNYSKGIFPHELNPNKNIDKLFQRELTCDWESLRVDVLEYGMMNSVLSALMPVESSSLVTNSTNGIEPPRDFISIKTNKSGQIPFVVPEAKKLSNKYTLAWDDEDINSSLNKITGVIQKWIDQAISVNHYYNPLNFDDNMIDADVVVKDIVEFYKYGGKNLYYANTMDKIDTEDCDACKL